MRRKLFSSSFVLLALLCLVVVVEADSFMWAQTYGGTALDGAKSLVETLDGGYAIAGATESFGNGDYDFWLVKTDAYGNMEWNQTYGGTDSESASSVVTTLDGGYAIAGTNISSSTGYSDVWLVKTDEFGNMEWNQTYGGPNWESAKSLVATSDGGYAIAGTTTSFGDGMQHAFWLVKTDEFGNMEWNQTYGKADHSSAYSLVQVSEGGFAMAGYIGVIGDFSSTRDFLLVKTDEFGNEEWNRTYGGTETDWGRSLVATSDGGYAIAGYTRLSINEAPDFWLVKTDAYGNMEWNQTYGGTSHDQAYSLVAKSDGGYAIAGTTRSFGAGIYDFWLVKTDAYGNMEWNQTYGGTEHDEVSSLIQTSDGGYALAGDTDSFGAGNYDFWLVRTNEYGIPEYSSWILPSLLLIATSAIVIYKKKLLRQPSEM